MARPTSVTLRSTSDSASDIKNLDSRIRVWNASISSSDMFSMERPEGPTITAAASSRSAP